jgi:RNA polymerase sigma-70 factor (ECF subfamily)
MTAICRQARVLGGDQGELSSVRPVPQGDRVDNDRERVLLARLVAGDDLALGEVYNLHGAYVFRLARRVTGSERAAEDVVQETFVRLWERPHDVDLSRGSLRTFLGVVAHRRSVDWVRSESRRHAREEKVGHRQGSAPAPDIADDVAGVMTADRVRAALDEVPEAQREAVTMAYFGGFSYREVAERLGIPEGTAKSRMRMALARLAQLLQAEGPLA